MLISEPHVHKRFSFLKKTHFIITLNISILQLDSPSPLNEPTRADQRPRIHRTRQLPRNELFTPARALGDPQNKRCCQKPPLSFLLLPHTQYLSVLSRGVLSTNTTEHLLNAGRCAPDRKRPEGQMVVSQGCPKQEKHPGRILSEGAPAMLFSSCLWPLQLKPIKAQHARAVRW